ncbi:Phosphoacetylglucosamine mutase, partial [Linum perenne]
LRLTPAPLVPSLNSRCAPSSLFGLNFSASIGVFLNQVILHRISTEPGVKLSYGTAGFRADASILHSTVFRVGILAALRSLKTQSVIGLMITASHNQVSDNGIKIADPSGGMLTQEWEPFADSIANAPTPQDLLQLVEEGFTLMDPGMWRYSWEETPGPVANLFSKLQNK